MDNPAPKSDRRSRSTSRTQNHEGRGGGARAKNARNKNGQNKQKTNGQNRNANGAGQRTARDDERELDAALDLAAAQEPENAAGFDELGLPGELVDALSRRKIHAPFAIQTRTLPDALAGRDVLGRGRTGSGKTLAFGIPMLARLAGQSGAGASMQGGGRGRSPRGLILTPTRELAQQVTDALRPLARPLGLGIVSVYGGAPMQKQISLLRGGIDVVVATPGRLIDLMEQGECELSQIEAAVIDEADYMADLGFLPAVTRILDETPGDGQRMLFSATLDRGVSGLVRRYLREPAFHAVAPAAAPVDSVTHKAFVVKNDDKVAVAAEIAARPARTLIFVRTKHGADRLARQLERSGLPAAAIHGNLRQGARTRALSGFSSGEQRILVATDVAARGIHVDDVDLVMHFDPAADSKDYLHRSGRTARAGASGTVVSLALPDQRAACVRLLEDAKVSAQAEKVQPGDAAVRELAESGEPVVVTKPARSQERSGAPKSKRQQPGGRGKPPRNRTQQDSASPRGRRPQNGGRSGQGRQSSQRRAA